MICISDIFIIEPSLHIFPERQGGSLPTITGEPAPERKPMRLIVLIILALSAAIVYQLNNFECLVTVCESLP